MQGSHERLTSKETTSDNKRQDNSGTYDVEAEAGVTCLI